jgi:hypothetical protein
MLYIAGCALYACASAFDGEDFFEVIATALVWPYLFIKKLIKAIIKVVK